jgi:CopG family nickel-responsive transcriptional regulator
MATPNDTIRLSVSLPESLREELDSRIIAKGYASRSEFVRDLIREQIVADKWADANEDVVGVLTISYDHHQRALVGKLIEAQHSHYVNKVCSTHVHLDHDTCLEVIIIQGKAPQILKLSRAIGGIRGVKFAKLTRASKLTD